MKVLSLPLLVALLAVVYLHLEVSVTEDAAMYYLFGPFGPVTQSESPRALHARTYNQVIFALRNKANFHDKLVFRRMKELYIDTYGQSPESVKGDVGS